MNRQVAFAYATAGVAASITAIVMVGSAFGFGLPAAAPAAEADWVEPATAGAAGTDDYEAEQAAYEASLEEYRQSQADAVQAQVDADWATVLDQRAAAQAAVAADVDAQREAGLQTVEAQLDAQAAAAAAELQAWIDEQRTAALDALAADIGERDQEALDDLEGRLAATQGSASAAAPAAVQQQPTTTAPQPTAPTVAPTAAPTPAPTAAPTPSVEYLTYGVGGVGEVVLAYTGDSISLYGVYAGTGWVYEVERNGPREVKLKFFNTQTGNDEEWKAELEGGRIRVEN